MEQPYTFPDAPRGELDLALDNLVEKARDVLKIQGRLRSLLRANQAVIENIDLPVVLERIVSAAVELVGAKYGALGVIAPDGTLEQFINVGMTPEEIQHIGHLPTGHGLLGALVADPRPIRLEHLSDDDRSAGFPAHHPPMGSFLGVPVRVRDEVYGNLYLSNQASGSFSSEDEQLVIALAATAGVAIENARLFAETHRQQEWASASSDFASALLSTEDGALATLAKRVHEITDAHAVWVLLPTPDATQFLVGTACGIDQERLQGRTVTTSAAILARVVESQEPQLGVEGLPSDIVFSDGSELGAIMAIPFVTVGLVRGILVVGRANGGHRFNDGDLGLAADFARQSSVAMELAAARADRQKMLLLEDRGRIARDLHDHVIQQLFATGLELQSISGIINPGPIAERIAESVANIDASISQIRTVIFALSASSTDARVTVRHRIIDLANEVSASLGSVPSVSFAGPVDLVVDDSLASEIVAVTREALANVAKHAEAQQTIVSVAVRDSLVVVEITDDGRGMGTGEGSSARRSGLANLEKRALLRGGSLLIDSTSGGTRLCWTVPYEGTGNE
jgi:signal transduction histidine kinase